VSWFALTITMYRIAELPLVAGTGAGLPADSTPLY
jgi:hypothetical protein